MATTMCIARPWLLTSFLMIFAGVQGTTAAAAPPPVIGPLVAPPLPQDVAPEIEAIPESMDFDIAAKSLLETVLPHIPPPLPTPTLDQMTPLYDPATDHERALLYAAMHNCDNAAARYAKPFLMLELLRVEADAELPDEMRGILLAAWCGEAAYQLDDIIGDGGRAVGILQMHTNLTSKCGSLELRTDPIASAKCWVHHLARIQRKSVKRCGKKRSWKAAELWLSQGGTKSGYSCKLVSGHVARLERWHRGLRRDQRLAAKDAAL
jgi:hypothetical protein